MQFPLVTVVALSYNNAAYIVETLDSIKFQRYPAIELLVIDDSSTDNSLDIINDWITDYDGFAKLIVHDKNVGVCFSCNEGLAAASGKYMCIIGTDDVMHKDRIFKQVELFEKSDYNIAGIYSDMAIIDKFGDVINNSFFHLIGLTVNSQFELLKLKSTDLLLALVELNSFPAPAMMYRVDALRAVDGYDNSLVFEDLYMNINLIKNGYQFLGIDDKLTHYRIIDTSLSRKPSAKYLDSYLRVLYSIKGLEPILDKAISKKIGGLALEAYEMDSVYASKWLQEKFKNKPSILAASYVLAAKLGFSYKFIQKIKGLIKS